METKTDLDRRLREALEDGEKERKRSAELQKQSKAFHDTWQKLVVCKTEKPVERP